MGRLDSDRKHQRSDRSDGSRASYEQSRTIFIKCLSNKSFCPTATYKMKLILRNRLERYSEPASPILLASPAKRPQAGNHLAAAHRAALVGML